jgi:hypothetical protein
MRYSPYLRELMRSKCRIFIIGFHVIYKGSIYTMEVNAASFIFLYNSQHTLYFGCSSTTCRPYFVLPGGNASQD